MEWCSCFKCAPTCHMAALACAAVGQGFFFVFLSLPPLLADNRACSTLLQVDLHGLLKEFGHDIMLKHAIWIREKMFGEALNVWARGPHQSHEGRRLTLIADMAGLTMGAVASVEVLKLLQVPPNPARKSISGQGVGNRKLNTKLDVFARTATKEMCIVLLLYL